MKFLSTIWFLSREQPRGSKDDGPKRKLSPSVLHDPARPAITGDSTISASQWSPVSVTFEQTRRPHVLVKRSKSLKSITRRPQSHSIKQVNGVAEHSSGTSPSNDRKKTLLNVAIVPLARHKSTTSVHKMDASPTCSDASSLSSHTSERHSFPLVRRSASQASTRHPREYFDHNTPLPPLPNSTIVPPVHTTYPGALAKPGKKKKPRRSRTADSTSVPGCQHPLPTRPIIADAEGYWDHLELLDFPKGRGPPILLPRRPHRSPIPF
ncbi:hypothetical protein E1B28_003373 [Marasmius oreades]|uniref:Uncharacterized protein n=1 Tax=Marasmius oreades TaxID=181124 RepID=A0A9P7RMC1_9AGAR|nr:uncharacterized protein E1B28_003373 [Marasmius oreades]KAG7085836.1 hypothetical protein E1B28_003373 [Marasmius oreades]